MADVETGDAGQAEARVPLTRRETREREAAALLAQGTPPVPPVARISAPEPIENESQPPVVAPVSYPLRAQIAANRTPSKAARPLGTSGGFAPVAKRGPRRFRERAAGKLLSAAAMLFAGVLIIGMSVPANAFMTSTTSAGTAVVQKLPTQSVAVAATAAELTPTRDTFNVTSYAEQLKLKYGNRSYSFAATTGAVRWPFPYAVTITDGWGARVSPCLGCSTFHKGVDFTPGAGAPIYAIADGVVSYTQVSDSGLGNNVVIDHLINGQRVQSVYAHMQMNSSPLKTGTPIKVGDFVGLVGQTGSATGPHLHFEIHLDGVAVDPFAWLTANAVN